MSSRSYDRPPRRGSNRSGGRDSYHAPNFRSSVPSKRSANDAEEDAWVAGEDRFVLQQAKQRAFIRVREGRARPIDWLAIVARVLFDRSKAPLSLDGDPDEEEKVEIVDPEGVFASLRADDLKKLKTELDMFCNLESDPEGKKYWNTMQTICTHRLKSANRSSSSSSSGPISVEAEIEKLLHNKSESELAQLEGQIRSKLQSRDCVDVEYWENLLSNLIVLKDKAHLKKISQAVITKRLERLRAQQQKSTELLVAKLCTLLNGARSCKQSQQQAAAAEVIDITGDGGGLDPEPLLSLRPEDKPLRNITEGVLLAQLGTERANLRKLRYVPARPQHEREREIQSQLSATAAARKRAKVSTSTSASGSTSRFALPGQDSFTDIASGSINSLSFPGLMSSLNANSSASNTSILAAVPTVENDEEMLHAEDIELARPEWASQYKPRKPRYFNRVVMGYEWNKYNQTHFDHDNPPPKVPQGYKFNIFYPDLIDRTKAPTYRIEREKNKVKMSAQAVAAGGGGATGEANSGQGNDASAGTSSTSTGMFDTCLIRFISGPPYEDICFRIVDREWDYSAKRERAFRSNFTEKGLLELHFQFKKIYYRK